MVRWGCSSSGESGVALRPTHTSVSLPSAPQHAVCVTVRAPAVSGLTLVPRHVETLRPYCVREATPLFPETESVASVTLPRLSTF